MSADSSSETTEPQAPVELRRTLDRLRWQREQLQGELKTVSYTHLTLPTILRV